MGPRPGHQCSKCQQCWRRGPGVNATRRHWGRGRVMPCGVGTWHMGMERVSNGKRKRNKKKLTKWHRRAQWPALMNPEEWRGRLTQQAVGWGVDEGWGRCHERWPRNLGSMWPWEGHMTKPDLTHHMIRRLSLHLTSHVTRNVNMTWCMLTSADITFVTSTIGTRDSTND